jgi:hypothetical protein
VAIFDEKMVFGVIVHVKMAIFGIIFGTFPIKKPLFIVKNHISHQKPIFPIKKPVFPIKKPVFIVKNPFFLSKNPYFLSKTHR